MTGGARGSHGRHEKSDEELAKENDLASADLLAVDAAGPCAAGHGYLELTAYASRLLPRRLGDRPRVGRRRHATRARCVAGPAAPALLGLRRARSALASTPQRHRAQGTRCSWGAAGVHGAVDVRVPPP